MLALIRKEVNSFFAGPIGYLVIALFLIINSLFLWVFAGPYNILVAGFADLSTFFELAPWVLSFLIPAVTMKAFSEERKLGTLELLLTKPLSLTQIVGGKYLGALVLIVLAIIPTLLYIPAVGQLGDPPGNLDVGSTIGSYLGLIFLSMAYTAIGIFASTLSQNQIVAFIIAVFLCFFMYFGFEGLASITSGSAIDRLGLKSHFSSMARGVIDTRDVIYFLSVGFFFLALSKLRLKTLTP